MPPPFRLNLEVQMTNNKKPEEWEALETDLHRVMYKYYCEQRASMSKDGDTHSVSVFNTSIKFMIKNDDAHNIAQTMHWDERYNRDFLQLPVDTSNWGKEDYRKFVKDAVTKINSALNGVSLTEGITNAKDMKSAVDALEKLTRLDLILMGEASEHIVIDVNKRPDEMSDDELTATLMQLQKRIPHIAEEVKETEDEDML